MTLYVLEFSYDVLVGPKYSDTEVRSLCTIIIEVEPSNDPDMFIEECVNRISTALAEEYSTEDEPITADELDCHWTEHTEWVKEHMKQGRRLLSKAPEQVTAEEEDDETINGDSVSGS